MSKISSGHNEHYPNDEGSPDTCTIMTSGMDKVVECPGGDLVSAIPGCVS